MTTVTLFTAIKRGDETIATVAIREPKAGELRGAKLTDVLQMDVGAMLTILPRVTEPALMPAEIAGMGPADFLQLTGALVGFFAPPSERAALTRPN